MNLVFWWNFPCKAISGLWRELANIDGYSVKVVCTKEMTQARKSLGWYTPDVGKAKLQIIPKEDGHAFIDSYLKEHNSCVHVFSGIYYNKVLAYALDQSQNSNIRTAIMTEAPFNQYTGLKRKLKAGYIKYIIPIRVKKYISKSLFVMSLSGNCPEEFQRQGWKPSQIFPFAYFSDEQRDGLSIRPMQYDKVALLCTGYITKNKGQEVLIKALKILMPQYGHKLRCYIAGLGPEEKRLKELSAEAGLEGIVKFTGVVPDKELTQIKQQSHIFVAPGFEEPWGIRINEAIQNGLPVIVSDGIRGKELVLSGATGRVFNRGSSESLAKAIQYYIEDTDRLNQARVNTIQYAPKISPREAALYFKKVIEYKTGLITEVPGLPIWLCKSIAV